MKISCVMALLRLAVAQSVLLLFLQPVNVLAGVGCNVECASGDPPSVICSSGGEFCSCDANSSGGCVSSCSGGGNSQQICRDPE